VGEVGSNDFLSRCAARDGDEIWVTGRLGGSYDSGKHLRFRPRLAEARWLAQAARPSAMMDLSDGLGADLPRLARRSGLGFVLQEDRIPRSPGCDLARALGDGEDYELIFTASPAHTKNLASKWRAKFPRLRLTRIGEMRKNASAECPVAGFQHF
jgi:thiamine-monophosphate kinase